MATFGHAGGYAFNEDQRGGHHAEAPVAPPPPTMWQIKKQAVRDALERHEGSKPAAAAELGISLKSVYNILAAIGQEEDEADA